MIASLPNEIITDTSRLCKLLGEVEGLKVLPTEYVAKPKCGHHRPTEECSRLK
jgi:hypothetical protein